MYFVQILICGKLLKGEWKANQCETEEKSSKLKSSFLWTIQACSNEDIKVLRIMKESDAVYHESLLTWCHCAPAETPTSRCIHGIRVEEDLHSVAPGRYDWRHEVIGVIGTTGVATAVVHQGCPVPICDSDKVA